MITKKIRDFLKRREFITIATCDGTGHPNVSPKFFLKQEGNCLYLIDYALGKTLANVTVNSHAALTFMDTDSLTGYQMYGEVEVLRKGPQFMKMLKELHKKQITLSASRIADGVRRNLKHEIFELNFPEEVVIYKIRIVEQVEVLASGLLKEEKI